MAYSRQRQRTSGVCSSNILSATVGMHPSVVQAVILLRNVVFGNQFSKISPRPSDVKYIGIGIVLCVAVTY